MGGCAPLSSEAWRAAGRGRASRALPAPLFAAFAFGRGRGAIGRGFGGGAAGVGRLVARGRGVAAFGRSRGGVVASGLGGGIAGGRRGGVAGARGIAGRIVGRAAAAVAAGERDQGDAGKSEDGKLHDRSFGLNGAAMVTERRGGRKGMRRDKRFIARTSCA
jgi:hypothetical protein